MSGIMERVPISRTVNYLQSAIVNLQLFDLGTGAIMSLAPLVSLRIHLAHSGAGKGVLS
jgi:hypothetical protein